MNRSSHAGSPTPATVPKEVAATVPDWTRLLAIAAGAVLMGSYLAVLYRVVDVVGGVRWFALGVCASLVLATAVARLTSVRRGLILGGLLLVGGVGAYVLFVPSLHEGLLTLEFVLRWLSYLSGVSVLEFRRVDLWAIAVAPGPAFLSWFLLLSRRYDASAVVGGLMLGFFALTGDAGATTTLVGMTSLLATLGVGTVERETGTVRELVRIGFVLALAVVVARSIDLVPGAETTSTAEFADPAGPSGPAISGDLQNADEEANIAESISLSPTVFFTVSADAEAEWRVGTYDRYTGDDWIRTGGSAAYDGGLPSPPGETTTNEQTIEVERSVRTLPAAWKPVEIRGPGADAVRVTDHGDLTPARTLEPGETYSVRSEVPDVTDDVLREAGEAYPQWVHERYLQLPESTPDRVGELAREITADEETAYDAAVAIRRWLSSQKLYDLSVERPPGDVVDAFLFGMTRGYCVYFASAMAVLLREIGVPSRFVLGYSTGQSVGDNRWVVRGLDSHAWVEVYFPGHGWASFDPTPETARLDARIDELERARREGSEGVDTAESRDRSASSIDAGVDPVEVNSTVTGTATTGENLSQVTPSTPGTATSAPGSAPASGDPVVDSVAGVDDAVGSWLEGRDRIALLAGAASAGIGLYWLGAVDGLARSIRLRWQRPTDSPRRDVERAYERFELLLARRYRVRSPGETRRQYVAEVGDFGRSGRVRRLLDLYERASYGDGVSRAEADEAIRLVDALVASER